MPRSKDEPPLESVRAVEHQGRIRALVLASGVAPLVFVLVCALVLGPTVGLYLLPLAIFVLGMRLRVRFLSGIDLYPDKLVLHFAAKPDIHLALREIAAGPRIAWYLGGRLAWVVLRKRRSVIEYWVYCDRSAAERFTGLR